MLQQMTSLQVLVEAAEALPKTPSGSRSAGQKRPRAAARGEWRKHLERIFIKDPSPLARPCRASRFKGDRTLDEWPRWLVAEFLQKINQAEGTL
jgi:hypothetical protein